MRKNPLRVRVFSLGLAFCIFTTSHLSLPSALAQPAPESAERPALKPGGFQIPAEMGKIEETFEGRSAQTVILLRDAHSIPEAQRNIGRLIEYFLGNYSIGFTGVEGAAGKLDPEIFRSFPDPEILQKVFEEYAAKGELTGVNAAAIFAKEESVYEGLEDWALYEESIRLYQEALAQNPAVEKKLEVLKSELENRKAKIYSPELLAVDRLLGAFEENQKDLITVLKKLAEIQPPAAGSELALVFQQSQENPDAVSVETEVRKIAEVFAPAPERQRPGK